MDFVSIVTPNSHYEASRFVGFYFLWILLVLLRCSCPKCIEHLWFLFPMDFVSIVTAGQEITITPVFYFLWILLVLLPCRLRDQSFHPGSFYFLWILLVLLRSGEGIADLPDFSFYFLWILLVLLQRIM